MSPAPQAIPPPSCCSASRAASSVWPSACHQSGPISAADCINDRPKNAWKAMVTSSTSSLIGYGGRCGPGSMPTSDQMNR